MGGKSTQDAFLLRAEAGDWGEPSGSRASALGVSGETLKVRDSTYPNRAHHTPRTWVEDREEIKSLLTSDVVM